MTLTLEISSNALIGITIVLGLLAIGYIIKKVFIDEIN